MPRPYGQSDHGGIGGNNLNRSQWPQPHSLTGPISISSISPLRRTTRFAFRANFAYHNSNDTDYFRIRRPGFGGIFSIRKSAGFSADEVHVFFSPSFVMDVRVSDSRYVPRGKHRKRQGKNFKLGDARASPSAIDNQIAPGYHQFPAVTVHRLYTSLRFPATPAFSSRRNRVTLTVSFDKIKGSHDFKFGAEYRQLSGRPEFRQLCDRASCWVFTEAYTVGPADNSAVFSARTGAGSAALRASFVGGA